MSMWKNSVGVLGAAAAVVLLSTPAQAASIIGSFYFTNDPEPTVMLENLSNLTSLAGDFDNVTLELHPSGGGPSDVFFWGQNGGAPTFLPLGGPGSSLPLGPGESGALNLGGLPPFDEADVDLGFQGGSVNNTPPIDVNGDGDDLENITVPEPAMLLLFGAGLALVARRSRARS